MKVQKGFFFDQTRCSGCHTCVVACKQWHSSDLDAKDWRRVETLERGVFPEVTVSFVSLSCLHCEFPSCLSACPVSAISKGDDDGIVRVDPALCLGESTCGACRVACPYELPAFGGDSEAKMEKCDLCSDRLLEGKRPICVEACPMRALDAGAMDVLRERHGNGSSAQGFHYSEEARPSVIFKSK